jgi:hypothetical protein
LSIPLIVKTLITKIYLSELLKKNEQKSKFVCFVFDRLLPRLTYIFSIFNHILNVIHLLLLSPQEIFIGRTSDLVHIFFYWSYFPVSTSSPPNLPYIFFFFLTNSAVLMPTDGLGMFARIWVIKSDLFFYQLIYLINQCNK